MIDFEILKDYGTTNERLREFFTAAPPSPQRKKKLESTPDGKKELKRIEADVRGRQEFEQQIASWVQEGIVFSLRDRAKLSAVDLAWDAMPIKEHILPLMQYAAGRLDFQKAVTALKDVPCGGQYIKKNEKGEAQSIDLPKFTQVEINLIRSVITRRVAAQAVKYDNLWPWFNYEPRDMTQVGRLRGDLTSQRMDIMADQYDYRHQQTQETRDMFLYTHSISFPRASWEREIQLERKDVAPEFKPAEGAKIPTRARVVKEGVAWVNPHPGRVFSDNNYPLSSLNCDIGCEHIGFWDVTRSGDIRKNPAYFNRDKVTFSANSLGWFGSYASYFQQYFDMNTISAPKLPGSEAEGNDRKNNVGLYTAEMDDTSAFITHLWVKVIPRNLRLGTYPHPIWIHLKVAGDNTVIYADIMPSSPAAVASYNAHDGRVCNISVAHELMPFQDQLTNLFSQLLEETKRDLFAIGVLNEDVFPDDEEGRKSKAAFVSAMKGENYYASIQILTASFSKLAQVLGQQNALSSDNIFKIVRSEPNTALNEIFSAITTVISLADRLQVMSSNENGQAIQHETSATENTLIAKSTDTVYSFISSAIDEQRAAKKRICFESLIACSSSDLPTLPVMKRYPDDVIKKAGFDIKDTDDIGPVKFVTVTGGTRSLVHDYIFTSRDGGNRMNSPQGASVLVQLLGQGIGSLHPAAQNAILSAMGKGKLFEIINTIFRMLDVGVDMNLEVQPGDGDELLLEDDQQVMGAIQKLAAQLQQNVGDVQQIKAALAQMVGSAAPPSAPPANSVG
jgi:hypothetical protein